MTQTSGSLDLLSTYSARGVGWRLRGRVLEGGSPGIHEGAAEVKATPPRHPRPRLLQEPQDEGEDEDAEDESEPDGAYGKGR